MSRAARWKSAALRICAGSLKRMKPTAESISWKYVERSFVSSTGLPAHDRAARHEAELRPQRAQRLRARGGRVARRRLPAVDAVEHLDRLAAPAELVVHVVPAGRDRERVDVVLARRRRAPRVVAPAPELDVEVEPDERGAAGVDAGLAGDGRGVHVLLHEDLRVEVGDLRAGDHQRLAARRLAGGDEHRVGGRARELEQPVEQALAPAAGARRAPPERSATIACRRSDPRR